MIIVKPKERWEMDRTVAADMEVIGIIQRVHSLLAEFPKKIEIINSSKAIIKLDIQSDRIRILVTIDENEEFAL